MAVASDRPIQAPVPVVGLDDVAAVAALAWEKAEPLDVVLAALEGGPGQAP
ncbi:MAG: hypothetical protein WDN45_13615 [Caulobacteraceae bacterium]